MAIESGSEKPKIILDYALKYFEIHAAQRMSVFNFFIVLSSIILTGLATCVVGERVYAPIGIPLGLLLTALAFTFSKLDQRTSFLVKRAEVVLERIEADHFPEFARIIGNEPTEFNSLNDGFPWRKKRWTYSKSLGLVFFVVAIMGVAGTVLSTLRATGEVQWFDKQSEQEMAGVNVLTIQSSLELPVPRAPKTPADKKEQKPSGPAQAPH